VSGSHGRRYRYTVLGFCLFSYFATMAARTAVSPVLPSIREEFLVSNAAMGLVLTGMWGAYALTSYPSGVLGDRYGERRVVLAAVGLTAVGSGLLAVSPTYTTFLLSALFLGAGAGLYYPVAAMLLEGLFERTGRAIGLHLTGSQLAGLATPVVVVAIAVRYGWRAGVAFGVVTTSIALVLFAWRVEPTPPSNPEASVRRAFAAGRVLPPLRNRRVLYAIGLAGVGSFAWQGTATFLPTFVGAEYGFGPTTAGGLLSVFFVTLTVSTPVAGSLSDWISRDGTAGLLFVVAIGGYGLLLGGIDIGLPAATVGTALVGVGMSWPAALESRMLTEFEDADRGAGFGLARGSYLLIGAGGNVGVGALADLAGWPVAIGALAGLLVVCAAVIGANRLFSAGF
jgi:MFS family permease